MNKFSKQVELEKISSPGQVNSNIIANLKIYKFYINLIWVKSISLILKIDKKHCIPHLQMHATSYFIERFEYTSI